MNELNLLITGAGGQGIILASDIIGMSAISAGYDVKKTDSLGMAQRGGSVVSHLRIAGQVFSPLIRPGAVDILLSFEKLEAARWAHYLKPGGIAIVNNHALPPLSVSLGNDRSPVEGFLMGELAGHCEYFASAMVVLARAVGIPARLVNGFAGGRRNRLGVFELGQRRVGALVSHALAYVQHQVADQVGFVFVLFQIELVRSAEHFPIDVAQVIPRRILAMLGEFDRKPAVRTAMQPSHVAFHDVPRA